MHSWPRKFAAEFLGTFGLVLLSTGAVCADAALRAAGRDGLGALGIALAYGLAAGALFTSLWHVSGGHFNPAVTIGFWVTRRMNTFETIAYWVAQIGGALTASYALRLAVPYDVWGGVALGTPGLAGGLTRGPAMLIEGSAAFCLVLVMFAAVADPRLGAAAGPAVGFIVAAGALFAGPFTGGVMNPARAFGPAVAAHHWTNQGVYWIGPLAGAMVAASLYDALLTKGSPNTT